MMLPNFDYQAPESISEACSLLSQAGDRAAIMAGGTDLIVQMKQGTVVPEVVISLRKLRELQYLSYSGTEGLKIGPMVNLRNLAASALMKDKFPVLAAAASLVGAAQHQSMGTVGGNLCLDTRCLYYNQPASWRRSLAPCLKLGGNTCHTVKAAKRCCAAYCADVGSVLFALGASVAVQSIRGERMMPLAEFFTGDSAHPTLLQKDELIREIIVPPQQPAFARSYKLRPRGALDFAQLGVIVVAFPEKREYRVVLNAVEGKPLRFKDLETLLAQDGLSASLIGDFAANVASRVKPRSNIAGSPAYRRKMIGILLKRAFTEMGAVS